MNKAIFSIQTFGKLEPYSSTISLARVRIFYTGVNRNSTYITEEFAEKLLSTLAYAPVKGIYDGEDYTDHGKRRDEGKIYGVVPENPNITWEDHVDDDGVTRTYACADVLLFTGIYPEAFEIINKGESMEIYAKSIKGNWQVIDKKRVFVYTEGCFLGLQALGDAVEPCFEGAAFFSLYNNLKNLIDTLEGGKDMTFNFKLSDSKKHDLLFKLVNPNFTEEGNYEINYSICDIYDEYALCYDYEKGEFCRFYYEKDDEKNTCTLTSEAQKSFIVDVSEAEYAALNLLKDANGGSFNQIDEVYTAANEKIKTLTSELAEKIDAYDTKVVEFETVNATLSTKDAEIAEKDTTIASLQETSTTHEATIAERDATIVTLNGELSTLSEYKNTIETSAKEAIVEKYTALVDAEVLTKINDKLSSYTIIDLEKDLAYEATKKNPSIFSKENNDDPGFIPTGNSDNCSGATKILMKHKKNK